LLKLHASLHVLLLKQTRFHGPEEGNSVVWFRLQAPLTFLNEFVDQIPVKERLQLPLLAFLTAFKNYLSKAHGTSDHSERQVGDNNVHQSRKKQMLPNKDIEDLS